MARIAYGVQGDAGGHVVRASAVAQAVGDHEFLFIGGGRTKDLRAEGRSVSEIPMLGTEYASSNINLIGTVLNGIKTLADIRGILARVKAMLRDFRPDLVITDYEFFTMLAARRLGIHCISIDNQHVFTKCLWRQPKGDPLGRILLNASIRTFYGFADRYFVTNFFQLPPRDPRTTEVFPSVLRQIVRHHTPREEDHILVYQTSQSFVPLLDTLKTLPHRCVVYGFGERPSVKNLVFKGPSADGFLDDLASCRYAVTNGSANVISEALYYGKPVLSFPTRFAYEQFHNGYMLRSKGYGDFSQGFTADLGLFEKFERGLAGYRSRITADGPSCGNDQLGARLNEILGSLTTRGEE
ncbi:MAG: glycosyltransferase family protein [Pseudomonadota bacterium]